MKHIKMSGEEAIAEAACKSSISLATGYPGSPAGGIITILENKIKADFNVHWSSNEKIAVEKAIGVAINGQNSLVCVKSVGLNVMLDPLTAVNLTPLSGGLVIIVGDDPGAYGSQNDQDSRPLARLINLPWFEPVDVQEAYDLTRLSFLLSKTSGLPVFIRITRGLANRKAQVIVDRELDISPAQELPKEYVQPRFVPGPKNAVDKVNELNERMKWVKNHITDSSINSWTCSKYHEVGVIITGSAKFKLEDIIAIDDLSAHINVAVLNSVYPLPEDKLLDFCSSARMIIVIEENSPYVAEYCKTIAAKLPRTIGWKVLAKPGELLRKDILDFLIKNLPILGLEEQSYDNEIPILKGHCGDSRYNEVLDHLDACCDKLDLEPRYYGDPGCLVTVMDRLYAKYAMGGSISTVLGANLINENKVINIALVGDSGLFHSALLALPDAVMQKASIPIVLLNNGSAKTTGGQKHPGVNRAGIEFDYERLLNSIGIGNYFKTNLDDDYSIIQSVIDDFLRMDGIRFLQIDINPE
jgi:indolepyruvate ferredoxin oxidoreductase alpha subunit